jgi:hypothetical protein
MMVFVPGAVVEGVEAKVPPPNVFFQGPKGIGVPLRTRAEGGHLDEFHPAKIDVNQAKAPADDPAAGEDPLELPGGGVGGDIVILRFTAQQKVAHSSAYDVGFKVQLAEAPGDHIGVGVDFLFTNTMIVFGVDFRLNSGLSGFVSSVTKEQWLNILPI